MADGGLTVIDGSQLRSVDLSLPESAATLTGARVIELAESTASSSLFGLALPETLKSAALLRLNIEAGSFSGTELDRDEAAARLKDLVNAIADELKDEPLVVAILDGNTLRLFLEDEDDFAMLAENLFTDLDTEDKGKLRKNEICNALAHMGVEMGIPPVSEFPQLNDILKKHGAEGEEELGQAQFAQVLQPVMQEIAEALTAKHVVVIQNIEIINGSKIRKILADEKQLTNVIEKILHDEEGGERNMGEIRGFLEKNGKEFGLPPSKDDEAVVLLYDGMFSEVENRNNAAGLEKEESVVLMKEILEKFAEQLEASPVFHDLDN
ncbi:hypothetical protein RJ640_012308 [Escallonia rubra]|uniref:EF-hand domain-containing protein n=1 Tax=Escallonia rubra TaxID=112253 RepID=A0AA88R0Q9_9ASTE|nr:hypothetical protein RJ640_012308 [Escallonia rubra]